MSEKPKQIGGRSLERIDSFVGPFLALSPYYICPVVFDGLCFPSSEHAYHAAKIKNPDIRLKLTELDIAPAQVDQKIQKMQPFIRKDWEYVKVHVMTDVLFSKFYVNEDLKALLMATDKREIVYNNRVDSFWGMVDGKGKNLLGRCLATVRKELFKLESACGL